MKCSLWDTSGASSLTFTGRGFSYNGQPLFVPDPGKALVSQVCACAVRARPALPAARTPKAPQRRVRGPQGPRQLRPSRPGTLPLHAPRCSTAPQVSRTRWRTLPTHTQVRVGVCGCVCGCVRGWGWGGVGGGLT
jgi:hypothetical protein